MTRNKICATLAAVAVLTAGCGGSSDADIAACKSAMDTSTNGIMQWTADKSTRPEACKGLDDDAFNRAASEWYEEFNKRLAEATAN